MQYALTEKIVRFGYTSLQHRLHNMQVSEPPGTASTRHTESKRTLLKYMGFQAVIGYDISSTACATSATDDGVQWAALRGPMSPRLCQTVKSYVQIQLHADAQARPLALCARELLISFN